MFLRIQNTVCFYALSSTSVTNFVMAFDQRIGNQKKNRLGFYQIQITDSSNQPQIWSEYVQ